MLDTSHIDLVALAGVPLKRSGKQMVGACPICRDGKDRFFIDTRKGAWGCRHCTGGSYRDALHFVAMRDGLDLHSRNGFKMACEALHVKLPDNQPRNQQRTPKPENDAPDMRQDYDSFEPHWQTKADNFVMKSLEAMQATKGGDRAHEYLRQRGIESCVITTAELGYNPEPLQQDWGSGKVYMPQGIVIPWHHGWKYTRIRVRTSNAKKYQQAAGAANGLYVPMHITPKSFVVLVEGEFDALALRSACIRYAEKSGNAGIHRVVPVATGGTTQGRVMRHVVQLSLAKRVLIAYDNDENGAGDKSAQWWLERLPNSRRWAPNEHDVNDMVLKNADVIGWLRQGLSD